MQYCFFNLLCSYRPQSIRYRGRKSMAGKWCLLLKAAQKAPVCVSDLIVLDDTGFSKHLLQRFATDAGVETINAEIKIANAGVKNSRNCVAQNSAILGN